MPTFSRTLNDSYKLQLVVSGGAQSISGNYTDVHWTLRLVKGNPNSWYYHLDGVAWSVREPDPTVAASGTKTPAYDFRDQNVTVWNIASGVRRVTHNSDGTYSRVWAGHWAAQHTGLGGGSVAGTVTLNTIPRATTPSWSGSFETGTSKKIDLPRASSGFTHDVTYAFGSKTGTITVGAGAYTHWIPPHSLLTEIPDSTSGTGTITVVTKSGSTVIGTKSKTFTLTANPSEVPTISSVLWDDNNTTVKNNIGAFVEGESLIKGTVNAAGVHGSTITSKRVKVGDSTVDEGVTIRAPKPGAGNIVTAFGEVTDSRGRIASLAADITVLPYTRPRVLSWQVSRANVSNVADENGEYLRIDLHAVASSLVVGSEKNVLKIKILTRPALGGVWTTRNEITHTLTHNAPIQVSGGAVFSTSTSYEVRVEVTDNVHTVAGPSDGVQTTVPTAAVALDLHGTQVGVGKRWEQGALDVAGDTYISGNAHVSGNLLLANEQVSTWVAQHRTFALKSQLDAWNPPAGTIAFVVADNQHYVKLGSWRPLDAPMPPSQYVFWNDATTLTSGASVWQNVPNVEAITMTVPQPLEVKATFGAVTHASTGYTMLGLLTSGATVVTENMATAGGPTNTHGAFTPFSSGSNMSVTGFKLFTLNPGETTFKLRARRSATGTHTANYPTLMVEPIRWA